MMEKNINREIAMCRKNAINAVHALIDYCAINDCNENCIFKMDNRECLIHDSFPFYENEDPFQQAKEKMFKMNNRR